MSITVRIFSVLATVVGINEKVWEMAPLMKGLQRRLNVLNEYVICLQIVTIA